ncbi:MAG TPA: hypothetical protein PLM33_11375 [Acidobacteriota bacterium]|jgi:hypothetical protein|nr:hypothetical protein [Acidobacteriota bacterium]
MPYLPVTVPSGNFTPGAQASLEFAAALINAAWEQANTKSTAFEGKISALDSWLNPATSPTMSAASVAEPTVIEPAVTIPATVTQTDILDTFDTKYMELVQLLSDKFVAFRTAFFPDEQNAYVAAENWLQDAVADPASGIPSFVSAQVWGDDRDRILADASRASDALTQKFAAMRYPIPPGALAAGVAQIQEKAQDEIAESSRKVAVLSVEQMKFAVEKLLGLRQAAMTSAVDYIKALASGPDMASRLVNVGYDAQSKLISSVASYYNARTAAAELNYKAKQHNADLTQDAGKENLKSKLQITQDKVEALLAEAKALAQMATSMYNNLHADAGTRYSVSSS